MMEDKTPDVILKQDEEQIRLKEVHLCTKCGLELPVGSLVCPTDGAVFDQVELLEKELGGRYEFTSVIASGGMGVVYKARQLMLDKVVAIKMMHSHMSTDLALARFQQEAKAASNLDHPGIIQVHDFGVSEHNQAFMVMDFVEGKPLDKLIQEKGCIPEKEAIDIFIQISEAVEHAHSKGVLHRDLKPSNIMLTEEADGKSHVKIVDFGIAKVQDEISLTQTGEVFGSPPYMSPEQCRGQKVDHRSDIYSLGCVMYETLTGSAPLIGDSIMETMFKQINDKPASIAKARPDLSFSAQMIQIVETMLAKQADDRYQSLEKTTADLKKLAADKLSIGYVSRQKRRYLQGLFALVLVVWVLMLMLVNFNNATKKITNITTEELAKMANSKDIISLDMLDAKIDNRPVDDRDLRYISQMSSLRSLNLRYCNVTDDGLAELEKLTKLEELRLSGTKVTGSGITHLKKLPVLTALSFSNMRLSPEGMAELSSLPLKELHLNNADITDEDIDVISKMTSLESLMVQKSKLTDAGLAKLSSLNNLAHIDLSHSKGITNAGLIHLGALKKLNQLGLQRTGIDDGGIAEIIKLSNLFYLNINGTDITDRGLLDLQKLRNLKHLTINSCSGITTRGVEELKRALPGCNID